MKKQNKMCLYGNLTKGFIYLTFLSPFIFIFQSWRIILASVLICLLMTIFCGYNVYLISNELEKDALEKNGRHKMDHQPDKEEILKMIDEFLEFRNPPTSMGSYLYQLMPDDVLLFNKISTDLLKLKYKINEELLMQKLYANNNVDSKK